MMSAVIQASGLGKAYRRTWALRDCTLAIPGGRHGRHRRLPSLR